MPRLKLKSIKIRNWGMVHGAELSFPEKGLVLVVGSNFQDSAGKLHSVGAGKSLLGEALGRALVGVPGRYANLSNYASDKKANKNMYVQVETTLDDKPLLVEMGYKCSELSKTGEGFRFTYGDQSPIQRAHLEETRTELEGILKINPGLAEWTVFVDGDKLKFNKLSEKKSVELLMSALSQPPWTQYHENSSRILANFKRSLEETQVNHQEAKNTAARAAREHKEAEDKLQEARKAFDDARTRADEVIAGLRKQLEKIQAEDERIRLQMGEIQKRIKKVEEDGAAEFKALDGQRLKLKSDVAVIQKEKEDHISSRATANLAWNSANGVLAEMKAVPKNCPTCSKPWDKSHSEEELNKQREAVNDKLKRLNLVKDKLADCTRRLQEKQSEMAEVEQRIRNQNIRERVKKLSREYEDCEGEISSLNRKAKRLEGEIAEADKGPSRSGVDKAEAVVQERARLITEAEERAKATARNLSEAEQAVTVVQYWHEAYGPTGIPNMILRDTIQPLNDISRRLSNLMTGGTIQISYDTKRELLSGKERAELVIKVDNILGSKKLEGSSKGEGGLTNLIVAETLSEVGAISSRIGWKWMDEVVNSQDQVVRRNIYNYLKEQAESRDTLIFIVDHHQEASSYADHILVATKTIDGTTFSWA